jgi:phosphoglycerate dehydrogenase-like enzyme
VFAEEPLPAISPLWKMENVLIMPHIASWTTAQTARAAEVLIENVRRHLNDEPLINLIDKKLLY